MIGDVLISSMICNNLKAQFPNTQIDYLVYPFTIPVLLNNPNIDNIIAFPESTRNSKIELFQFIGQIRAAKYDIVIDAYNKLESCLITMFSGASRRIGYDGKGLPFSYNEKVKYPEIAESSNGLAVERREQLLKAITANTLDLYPKLYVTDEESAAAKVALQSKNIDLDKSIIMVSILGSEPAKTYPIHYLSQLIDQIAKYDVKILFNYIPKQQPDAQAVYNLCSEEAQQKIELDLIGSDLRSFIAIMSHCSLIIGNDGGAVNIAKALNKPSFTIFSPWIEKSSWSIFEDGIFHKAVHLNDYKPEVISSKSRKELQSHYKQYYDLLTPELISSELEEFLSHHIKQ